VPSNYGRDSGAAYIARANQELFVAVQIETAEAYAALDDILAIPGLDSLVLGPQDLSGALGRLGDVEHPTVVAAIQTVIDKTRASGRSVGAGMGTDVAYAAKMAQRGVQWLQVGGDFGYLIEAMDGIAAGIRTRL
jgi:2-dehydro-3-deoxyglucarate aldolase/4-hydroxy-2-oxoheptanedioate aldolase